MGKRDNNQSGRKWVEKATRLSNEAWSLVVELERQQKEQKKEGRR